ncbi:MAG: DUF4384 domain-containing protein [Bryobacteraceae bacterium]|nr:DUF4384 domain-containing protein [Bryobacteraceae bacterium]
MLHRILFGLAAALAAFGQSKTLSQGPNRMELTLERQTASGWRVVDPGFVFQKDDRLRFRFRTNFAGYLYVMNQGTSGSYSQLFPREDTGTDNRVEGAVDYVVPATEGSFRVDGPAGYDVLYWVVAPVELGRGNTYTPLPPPPERSAKVMSGLRPRCDDSILRARGECVDSNAGAQAVPGNRRLPDNLQTVPRERSRQLVFLKQDAQSVVSSPAPLTGPVVYEFRLAHR